MSRPPPLLAAALLTAALTLPHAAHAEPSRPAPASDAEVSRRLAWVQSRLDRGAPAASRWWHGWYAGWVGLTVVQAGVAVGVRDPGLRVDAAVGAAFSALGVIPLGLFPFKPITAPGELRVLPAPTPILRRKKLAEAERLLQESAAVEAQGRSFLPHVLGGVASLGAGLVNVLAYKRPLFSGLVKIVGGMALCEIQIFSQPTAAITDWRDYQAQRDGAPRGGRHAPGASLSVVPSVGGLGLAGAF